MGLYCLYSIIYIYIQVMLSRVYLMFILKFGFAGENDLSYYVNVGYVYIHIYMGICSDEMMRVE